MSANQNQNQPDPVQASLCNVEHGLNSEQPCDTAPSVHKAKPAIPVREVDYQLAQEENTGFCSSCEDFTTSGVEPDAENYVCEDCGNQTVFGAEQALIMGMITFIGKPKAE